MVYLTVTTDGSPAGYVYETREPADKDCAERNQRAEEKGLEVRYKVEEREEPPAGAKVRKN